MCSSLAVLHDANKVRPGRLVIIIESLESRFQLFERKLIRSFYDSGSRGATRGNDFSLRASSELFSLIILIKIRPCKTLIGGRIKKTFTGLPLELAGACRQCECVYIAQYLLWMRSLCIRFQSSSTRFLLWTRDWFFALHSPLPTSHDNNPRTQPKYFPNRKHFLMMQLDRWNRYLYAFPSRLINKILECWGRRCDNFGHSK